MSANLIRNLFASDIERQIEEIIKVDQTDEQLIRDEIAEYVVTESLGRYYVDILERYRETPNKPHEGIAVWVSGFFGSGKSSFAKMLGLAIENRQVMGAPAGELFGQRTRNTTAQVRRKTIAEQILPHPVRFDVSTDRGIRSGNLTLSQILYTLFLHSLGYARDLDLSELEIHLEADGRLAEFTDAYARLYPSKKGWNVEKSKTAFALAEASRVMHDLDPVTYPAADSWVRAAKDKTDITPNKLAERCGELMRRQKPNHSLLFVVDEVGQFVARDVQKMLDLQAVVQALGVK